MTLLIQPLTPAALPLTDRFDVGFIVDSKLLLSAENGLIRYTIVPLSPYAKRYPVEELDYAAYLDSPDRTIYIAYVDGQPAGQIRLRRNWNGFAYIEDIVVDAAYRRRGVGRALLAQAAAWARERRLAGLMLETQDVNVAACRLYAACGFSLGGFDTQLYRGNDPPLDEVALYWYLVFEQQ